MNTEIIGRFSSRKVIVIGDIMLDKYVCGTVNRISPEAPVQIVDVKKEDYVLGGAANTANNIAALGASVVLVGIIGDDEPGRLVSALLRGKKITNELIKSSSKPTIQKIRIMAQNQQLLRIDYETKEDVDPKTEAALLKNIKSHDADMIIISDYMKGTITKNLAKEIPKLGKLVVVDPKSRGEGFYSKVTLMTPNNKEVC
ncbi:MAG: D-glycero-beta-D-manno-heptose-7-phosphate kinase, partial [Nanoarchaeota archaeon]|nr:D-glycero-beta-D-manno-heptose-7-phosphate kinase [Nanoarchaeota archaeon]